MLTGEERNNGEDSRTMIMNGEGQPIYRVRGIAVKGGEDIDRGPDRCAFFFHPAGIM
jgi:hypothetical protein